MRNKFLLLLIACFFLTPAYAEVSTSHPVYINQPNMSQEDFDLWLANTLPKLFTYTPSHYRNQLKKNQVNFTEQGFQQFLQALDEAKLLDEVTQHQLTLEGKINGKVSITDTDIQHYRYTWHAKATIDLDFSNSAQAYQNSIPVKFTVVRVGPEVSTMGVAIDEISFSDKDS